MVQATLDYALVVGEELDDGYYQQLRDKLRNFNRVAAPQMTPPDAQPLNIEVRDEGGLLVGGLAALTYWDWLVIRLLVLDDAMRGNGIGQRLIERAHQVAVERGCRHAQTATYDFQALQFYQKHGYRIVGELQDYPDGYNYYWLRREFDDRRQTDLDET